MFNLTHICLKMALASEDKINKLYDNYNILSEAKEQIGNVSQIFSFNFKIFFLFFTFNH